MPVLSLTLLLAALTMVGPIGIDMFLPSLPAIAHDFAASPILIQQTLSVYILTFGLMMLFHGTLSDSFGRRPVILVTLVLFILASIAAALAPSPSWLIAIRAIQGVAAGAGSVVGRAIVRDRFQDADARRIMSHITMVFGLAPALAPIIGGWLQATFGWRWVFATMAIAATLMLTISLKVLPETLPPEKRHAFHPQTILRHYWEALRHLEFLCLSLSIGFMFSGFAVYIGAAPDFIMNVLHLPETAFGWLFIPIVGGMVAGAAIAARLAHRTTQRHMIQAGFLIMLASTVVNVAYNLLAPARIPWAVLPLAGYSFGLSLAIPSMTLRVLDVLPHMRGLAASVQGAVQMMIFSLISGVVAPMLFGSALKMAFANAMGLGLCMLFWLAGNQQAALLKKQLQSG